MLSGNYRSDTNDAIDVLFVVVTYNSEKYIEQCVKSIEEVMVRSGNIVFRACVVDNSSIDGTREILNRLERCHSWLSTILLNKNVGFGAGNNAAIKRHFSKSYFLLNVDAYLIGDSISPALAALNQDNRIGVIGVPLVYPDGTPQSSAFTSSSWHRWLLLILGIRPLVIWLLKYQIIKKALMLSSYSRNFANTHGKPLGSVSMPSNSAVAYSAKVSDVDWVSGAAMILTAPLVQHSGGFDENIFLYGEDEDICITAKALGYTVKIIDTVPVAHHLGWGASEYKPKVALMKYTSLKYFIRKNVEGKFSRFLMRALLPVYVYGWRFPLVIFIRGR